MTELQIVREEKINEALPFGKKHRIHIKRVLAGISPARREVSFLTRSRKGFHPNMSTYDDNPTGPGNRFTHMATVDVSAGVR